MVNITDTKIQITFEDLLLNFKQILAGIKKGKEFFLIKDNQILFQITKAPVNMEWTEEYEASLPYKPEFVKQTLARSESARAGNVIPHEEVAEMFEARLKNSDDRQ